MALIPFWRFVRVTKRTALRLALFAAFAWTVPLAWASYRDARWPPCVSSSTFGGPHVLGCNVTVTPVALGTLGAIDWRASSFYTKSLTSSTTISYSNQQAGQALTLRIYNPANYTVTFPAATQWPGGTDPVVTTTGYDIVTLMYLGTNTYGTFAQNFL